MDRLSSCYFCGVAHDESLSEYPVVPKQLHPSEDTQRTAVLCSTCRRKLATVVETVVAAAEAPEADGEGTETDAEAVTETADDQSDVVDESGLDAGPDPMDISDANETVAEDYPEMDLPGEEAAADEPAESAAEERSSPESPTEAAAADAGEDDVDASEPDDATGEGADESDEQGALTRLEYSKVMRLLQNRPFPVDRGEIRDVAVNAYDIDPEQFDAITDLAVERDLIGEEDGQFVSPE